MSMRPVLHASVLMLAAAAFAAQAQDGRERVADEGLRESVQRIERETGGEVLRAEPYQRNGRDAWRFKVLTPEGRVRVLRDEPARPGAQPPRDPPRSEPLRPRDAEPRVRERPDLRDLRRDRVRQSVPRDDGRSR